MNDADHNAVQQFLHLSGDEREKKLAKMLKQDLSQLLLIVSVVANQDRQAITSHPHLQKAHQQIKRLQAKLDDKPGLVRDLRNQINYLAQQVKRLEDDVAVAQKTSAFNLEQLSEAHKKMDILKQDYEAERDRILSGGVAIEDDWNRIKNELEQADKVISALIRARNAHVASALVAQSAALADMEVAGLGVGFSTENVS